MLGSQIGDNLSTRCGKVAQCLAPDSLLKGLYDFGRKPVRIYRKRLIQNNPGYLPMSGCGILAL